MMMRMLAVLSLLALCACSSQIDSAEKRYEIVKKSGSADDICAQGRALVAAYLAANDSTRYDQRRTAIEVECDAARGDERMGIFRMPDGSKETIEPDNMESIE